MDREYFIYTLPNGIRCIHKRVPGLVTHCAITVNAGSRDEPASQEGIAHFTEHALFKGTNRRQAHHINCRLENLGGELNAFTTKEETVIHATTLKEDFGAAVELIADVTFNSTLPAEKIELEKAVVLDEINSYKDTPSERIWDEFEELLFEGSALGHNILGTKASVRRFSSRRIADFIAYAYNTDQMVFSAIGDIAQRKFAQVAQRHLGAIPPSPRSFGRTAPVQKPGFAKTAGRNTHQGHCIIGARAYDAYEPRRLALSLLVNILGGPAANSLLNIALREKNGLTYNIEASYTPFCDSGIAAVYFSCEKDKTQRCLELVSRQLNAVRNTPLSDRKLSMAKKQFTGQLSISLDSNEGAMLGAGKSLLLYDEVDGLREIHKKIEAITSSQIMEVANEIFSEPSTLIYR